MKLQRSITDLLAVINQVARGDLTLRGKVTNDALATWRTPSTTCLTTSPRCWNAVRKAAMEVTRLEQHSCGGGRDAGGRDATRPGNHEHVERVEELTVSMKQVSTTRKPVRKRHAGAGCGGARHRAVRIRWTGCSESVLRASDSKEDQVAGDRSLETRKSSM